MEKEIKVKHGKQIGFGMGSVALMACLGLGSLARGDDFAPANLTYSHDVAPIMAQHCVSCHRPGESAPMSLTSYEETRPWVKSIKKSVSEKTMPPWMADPHFGKFTNDISLNEKEIATLVKWAEQGAPQGNPAEMPKMPEFKEGWQLGQPDYVLELPEVDVPAEGKDYFPNLTVTVDIPEKHWVRAVEVRPGNRAVLHHIVLFNSGVGMASATGTFDALAVWAVGTGPVVYPEGTGRWVQPKMHLISNMHYHPNGTAQKDKTTVALYFGKGELQKEISSALAGTINIKIPPRVDDYKMTAEYYVNQDIKIISYFPHMHMRGKEMSFVAKYPDGREETLLDVPKYDFNWQWFYYPAKEVILPADTEITIHATYDNSEKNKNNPNPDQTLTFGEGSADEMMFGFMEFVPVEGVKPKPISPERKLAKMTAKFPANEIYTINAGMGMMSMKTSMHLPKEGGKGTWYFAFGGSVMPIDLTDVKWTGNEFNFDLEFFGGLIGKMHGSGTVDEAGNINGKFELDEKGKARMEEFQRNAGDDPAQHRGRAGAGAGFMMNSFKGTRQG